MSTLLADTRTLLLLWAIAWTALVAPAHALGLRPPPLPDDVSIMEAAPQVPMRAMGLAGRWEGTIIAPGEQAQHIFVVERLEATGAQTVWSMGDSPGDVARWTRISAALVDGNALVLRFRNATVTYALQPDGTLRCQIDQRGFMKVGVLRRTAEPTLPYAVEATPWPEFSSSLQPGVSRSEVRAAFPEKLVFAVPGPDAPSDRAKWAGRFEGWACREATCDIKLAVLKIDGDQADVVQLYASANAAPNPEVRRASFVGDELRIRAGGLRVSYRMRADGTVEMYRVDPSGRFSAGVLTRAP